nr:MAG TPA: hypothetical protein [Caudoviricetes sp.]
MFILYMAFKIYNEYYFDHIMYTIFLNCVLTNKFHHNNIL